MSNKYIVSIQDSLNEPQVSELGGKGASLVKLTKGEFPVPEGFILTTTSYDLFAKQLHLCDKYSSIQTATTLTLPEAEKVSDEIKELFMNSEFPMDYIEDLKKSIEIIKQHDFKGPNLLAVRSSATTEDLGDASFAGMQDTILNVPIELEAIKKAILQCWASLYTPRAILYRFEKHFPVIDTSIAVVVQRMIPSDKSGVIFSCDPQTSSREHISLDGVQGLGEALVSGLVSTDHWSIRKHYPIDKKHTELRIVERIINEQEFAFYTLPEGGTEKIFLKEKGKLSCFTDEEIYKISEYAVEIEEYYHKPMDIEFCIYNDTIYIVQARPITTLFELPDDLNPLCKTCKHPYVNYICFNNIQMMLKPFSYAGFSVLNRNIFNSEHYFRLINGFIYIDILPLMKQKVTRELFKSFFGNNIDREIANITYDYALLDLPCYMNTASRFPLIKTIFRIAPSFISIFLRYYVFGINPQRVCNELSRRISEMINYFNNMLDNIDSKIENHELTLQSIVQKKYTIKSLLTNIVPFMIISFKCRGRIGTILKKNNIDISELDTMCIGRKENIASQMDEQMSVLHHCLQQCMNEDSNLLNYLNELLEREDEIAINKYIESFNQSSVESKKCFYTEYSKFMKTFGRRGPNEIDMGNPRYLDKPSILLKMIVNTSFSDTEEKESDYLSIQAEKKVDEICSCVSNSEANYIRKYISVARLFVTYREHPKYAIISSTYIDRKLYLYYGKQMLEQHQIEDINDVFNLSFDELLQYEQHTLDFESFKPLLLKRKIVNQKYQHVTPPRVLCTPFSVIASISDSTKQELLSLPSNVLKGMPTSAGIIEGNAVVVTNPHEGHLQKGDILIAPATDPAWTPLFVPAAAVAIEIGGPLTHGSIIAREMGIPCVVNVHHLLEKVKTGMKIRIDGSKGTLELL